MREIKFTCRGSCHSTCSVQEYANFEGEWFFVGSGVAIIENNENDLIVLCLSDGMKSKIRFLQDGIFSIEPVIDGDLSPMIMYVINCSDCGVLIHPFRVTSDAGSEMLRIETLDGNVHKARGPSTHFHTDSGEIVKWYTNTFPCDECFRSRREAEAFPQEIQNRTLITFRGIDLPKTPPDTEL